jgi:hypothetical protein
VPACVSTPVFRETPEAWREWRAEGRSEQRTAFQGGKNVWKIEELEEGESVHAVAPILEGGNNGFTCRLVLTDRRLLTIRSPMVASWFGLARYLTSAIESATPLNEVQAAVYTAKAGGFLSSCEVTTSDGVRTYAASGIGSRRLRLLTAQLQSGEPESTERDR